MPKSTESLNNSLFELLRSKGYDPTMMDTSGKEIPVPDDAEVFQFNFVKNDVDYGKVTISIDGLQKLTIYYGDNVANSDKGSEQDSQDTNWYSLLKHLKRFAKKRQLGFVLKNSSHLKHDMAKRDYMNKKEKMNEGYYPLGKKTSYNDAVPTVKIVIEHSRQMELDEARFRSIDRIFLENQLGERFLLDTRKPGIARVYARHIAEGGKVNDQRWEHIKTLSEEYTKMSGFVRAVRNNQFNESAQVLVNEGIQHYQNLRETLSKMSGHRGYNVYFESWTPALMEDEIETNNLNELFVQETLDPRIESVMPILSKLHKKVSEMKEINQLEEWADSLLEYDEENLDEAMDDIDSFEKNQSSKSDSKQTNKPVVGTIKGGVWTADPPKKGEKGVPVPTPVDEELDEEGVAEGLNEMDKTQTSPGRDGDIDWTKKQIHLGPERMMKAKDVAKHALKALDKTMKKSTPKKKGVAEDQLDELSPATLKSYHKKAVDKLTTGDVPLNKFDKREAGAMKAYKKVYNQKGVAEGSGPKEKQKTPYRDINSPEYRAAANKQKQQMAKDKAAEPGKKLADKIAKKDVKEGQEDLDAILRIIRK